MIRSALPRCGWKARIRSAPPLSVHVAADEKIEGSFAGLAPDGALRLALASGEERRIHAADVMLGSA